MTTRRLEAFSNERHVGTLADDNGAWSFTYAQDWLDAADSFPLAPAFPLHGRTYADDSNQRSVQWFFDNLLPEEAMRSALAREARIDESDAWGLLAYYGRESTGALTLLEPGDREAPAGLKPLTLEALDARIRAIPYRALTADAPKRMSAAGAQPKLLVTMRIDELDELASPALFEPVGNEPSMHLLKPDALATGYPHAAINEFFCMRLARAVGLDVPATHFIRAPSPCYLVDRFDRQHVDGRAMRRHVIDATQLLDCPRAFKYTNINSEKLREAVDRTSARALARLSIFRGSVFNVLIGNADAHLKNLSFHVAPNGYVLAPFHDLVSTVVYHTVTYQPGRTDHWPQCELSMPIGGATHFTDISRDHLLSFGEHLGLTRRAADQQLDTLLTGFDDHVATTREHVTQVAHPDAGETRLLNAIVAMPIAEMKRKLRRA